MPELSYHRIDLLQEECICLDGGRIKVEVEAGPKQQPKPAIGTIVLPVSSTVVLRRVPAVHEKDRWVSS